MKRYFLVIALLITVGLAVNGQTSTPDDGNLKDGVYSNNYFRFSIAHPTGWVVHGEDTKAHIKEIGKARATTTGALSAESAEVFLQNTYQLLTTFQYPLGSPGVAINSGFMIVAENIRHAPGIVTGKDYLVNVRPLMIKLGSQPTREPVELVLSGRKFYRQDAVMDVNGVAIQQATVVGVEKGFALAFVISGKDLKTVEDAAKSLNTLKFFGPPTIPAKP